MKSLLDCGPWGRLVPLGLVWCRDGCLGNGEVHCPQNGCHSHGLWWEQGEVCSNDWVSPLTAVTKPHLGSRNRSVLFCGLQREASAELLSGLLQRLLWWEAAPPRTCWSKSGQAPLGAEGSSLSLVNHFLMCDHFRKGSSPGSLKHNHQLHSQVQSRKWWWGVVNRPLSFQERKLSLSNDTRSLESCRSRDPIIHLATRLGGHRVWHLKKHLFWDLFIFIMYVYLLCIYIGKTPTYIIYYIIYILYYNIIYIVKLGVLAWAYNPSTQEDQKFKVSLAIYWVKAQPGLHETQSQKGEKAWDTSYQDRACCMCRGTSVQTPRAYIKKRQGEVWWCEPVIQHWGVRTVDRPGLLTSQPT